MTQLQTRLDRRYASDEKGQPLRSKPCDNYQWAQLLDADGFPIETEHDDYCRCGWRKGRHEAAEAS